MIEADSRGIHSHGLMRLPIYIERMQKGFIRKESEITIEKDNRGTAVLNGHFSAGQVSCHKGNGHGNRKSKRIRNCCVRV